MARLQVSTVMVTERNLPDLTSERHDIRCVADDNLH